MNAPGGIPILPYAEKACGHDTRCWIWQGGVNATGYGRRWWNGRSWKAHRLAYTVLVGPIPDDRDIDHLCRVKNCINPAHLEPVTRSENAKRQFRAGAGAPAEKLAATVCKNGHARTPENTYQWGGRRWCHVCRKDSQRRGHA